ncbi:HAD family hydrolase [Prolixibacteraceae bacterium JC049]|nr:HAD family hydrolase [Prolixibacteraceae bacterium JC049]
MNNIPKIPTIFLDRDGVLNNNSELYYTTKKEDFVWVDGVFENLRALISAGYQLVIISNQGGVAKGNFSIEELNELNAWIYKTLIGQKIEIKAIYCCPHHNHVGNCFCRKPKSLFIERAIHRYHVDVNRSVMIGDSQRDIGAAEMVGVKGILVEANKNWKNSIEQLLK